jgi:hypothetical protein
MTGKRPLFFAFGSLGDVYSVLALAREMKGRGHTTPLSRHARSPCSFETPRTLTGAEIGARVRAETGLTNACDRLEELLRKSNPELPVLQQEAQ